MKVIKIIRDTDVGVDTPSVETRIERQTSRAVVFDTNKKIALLHATRKNYHKLPGGGVEDGESVISALEREVLEEVGCSITNVRDLAVIEEYRQRFALHQISYCYVADVLGEKGTPKLMDDEIVDGFKTVWVDINEAIRLIENERPVEDYEGKFINLRELTFLKEARRL